MLQEQIPFAVTSVPDLQQHVHLSTLGPCTHQDADMMRLIFNAIKVSIEKLVRMIIAHDTPNSCWPSNWPPALIIELVDSYKDLIIAGLKQRGIDYYAGLDLDKDITYAIDVADRVAPTFATISWSRSSRRRRQLNRGRQVGERHAEDLVRADRLPERPAGSARRSCRQRHALPDRPTARHRRRALQPLTREGCLPALRAGLRGP